MLFFAATIFLSAYLLFLVQPLIARVILPWFGGSAAVWTTCLMFFQTTLLAGYAYAHGSVRLLKTKGQATLHLALLAASVLVLPILPGQRWKPEGASDPQWHIVALLAATIGIPYVLLSTTGPLLQAWFARRFPGTSPYRLYALSNAGSLLALLSYPLVIEPLMRLRFQAYLWSGAYVVFVALCAAVAFQVRKIQKESAVSNDAAAEAADDAPPRITQRLLWMGLAFCPSALLVAVTSHMTQNIAPVPMLWVPPLALYLLSFILTFESPRWYGRRFWFPLWVAATAFMLAFLFPDKVADLRLIVPLFTIGFFICAVVCHGELYRLRPDARHLTSFYLMISIGGALGGFFVGVVAPALFRMYLELPIGLLITVALVAMVMDKDRPSLPGPLARYVEYVLLGALAGGLCFLLVWEIPQWAAQYRVVRRNFYGALRVEQEDATSENAAMRTLIHGTINHGTEFMEKEWRRRPTTYYGRGSGVGIALSTLKPMRKVGIIGLGAGTLSAYARPGDQYRFYEINPMVLDIARNEFYYLSESPTKVDVVLGDARLSLERETPQDYDVIAVDAFSGDSIPVHLLTVEAFREYFRHLKPDGVLAVHVSNKYLKLGGVVVRAARELGKTVILMDNPEDEASGVYSSDWMMVASQRDAFDGKQWNGSGRNPPPEPVKQLWTDDYSNLLTILKWSVDLQ